MGRRGGPRPTPNAREGLLEEPTLMSTKLEENVKSNGNGAIADVTSEKRPRILIVEDEPAMVAGLRDNFEYEGYEVISAGDGAEGLERGLEKGRVLFVLEVLVPRVGGFEVCNQARIFCRRALQPFG